MILNHFLSRKSSILWNFAELNFSENAIFCTAQMHIFDPKTTFLGPLRHFEGFWGQKSGYIFWPIFGREPPLGGGSDWVGFRKPKSGWVVFGPKVTPPPPPGGVKNSYVKDIVLLPNTHNNRVTTFSS